MTEEPSRWRRPKPAMVLAAAVVVMIALGVLVVNRLDRGDAPAGFDVAWQLDEKALAGVLPKRDLNAATPVVVGDVAVLAHERGLVAIDVATGGVRWTVPIVADQYCRFAKGPDAVYLNLSDETRACRTLVRIEPDGREAWRARIEGELPPVGTPMTIAGRPDGVIVVTARSIVAYPVTGGAPKWTHTMPANAWGDSEYGNGCWFTDAVIGVDAIATRVGCTEPAFATSQDSSVLELRAVEDGSVRHRGPVTSSRGEVLVYASSGGIVTAASTGTGNGLAFFDGRLRQTAVYPHTVAGATVVSALQGSVSRLPRDIQISGDLLIAVGRDRRPVAIRISTGQVEWRAEDGKDFGCGALVWDGALLVCGDDRKMSAYDLATGDLATDQGIDVDGLADPEHTLIVNWNRMVRAGDRVVVQDGESLIGLVRA